MSRVSRRIHSEYVYLGITLALGGILRFDSLARRGLIYWDEGKFALEGIRIQGELGALLGRHASIVAGKTIGTAKPTHALLIALSYFLLGVHDYSPLFMNALASLLQVVLVFLLGRRLFGTNVGVLAAILLAVSRYDIIYARSALSESDANLFFTAGVLLWSLRFPSMPDDDGGTRRWLATFGPGLLLGIAFTTNYRLVVYAAVLIAVDVLRESRQASTRRTILALGIWAVGFAIAPLLWEVVDLLARSNGVVLFWSEGKHQTMLYVQEAGYQLHQGKQSVVHFAPLPYLRWYLVREGWLVSVLTFLGLLIAVRRRSAHWMMMSALVLIPYVVYVFAPFIVPRNLDPALPFASILAAGALLWLVETVVPRRFLRVAAVLAALLLPVARTAQSMALTGERSGFARAANYVEAHASGRAIVSNEVMVFYLRGSGKNCDAPALPPTLPRLAATVHAGYRLAVLDRHRSSPIDPSIRQPRLLVATYRADGQMNLGESLISSENGIPPSSQRNFDAVQIFDLAKLRLPSSSNVILQPCSRDRTP